ncbi:YdgA family protein [Thiomicrospira microaerophila]|uniref:YdgA family protein n=1 Tax=Thiomicrospira microaerophila TaxID=406020 RepID=UPI00200DBF95|nr:YdgA family protein [Thiomicrospira microaerophila]UQB43155.1 YdgA family protein [Thiomicrospira microaerophila]
MSVVKKLLLVGAGLVITSAAAFFAASSLIGQGVKQAILNYEAQLIARDDVRVNLFEYQPGLLEGQLRYDLVWQPKLDSPAYSIFIELSPDGQGIPLKGEQQIQQGPWLGRSVAPFGFGLASTEYEVALPANLRPYLPQYPGQRPLIKINVYKAFNGQLSIQTNLIDYNGRLIDPETQETAHLSWEGGHLDIRFSEDLMQMTADGRLGLFNIDFLQEDLSIRLDNIKYQHDLTLAAPYLWLGTINTGLNQLSLAVESEKINIQGLEVAGDSKVVKDKLDATVRYQIGQTNLIFDDTAFDLAGASMVMALRDLDWQAIQELSLAEQQLELLEEQVLMDTFDRLLAGGPSFHLDQLLIRLSDTEYFNLEMLLGYQPQISLDWNQLSNLEEALTQNIHLNLTAGITRPMLDRLAILFWPFNNDETEIKAQLDVSIAEMLAQNYVQRKDEDLVLNLAVEHGQVKINGEDFLPLEDTYALVELATRLLGFALETDSIMSQEGAVDGVGLAGLLNYAASPLYGYFELAANFSPDPMVVTLQAGGDLDMSMRTQGQCLGYINPLRPDVTLNYQAGQLDLSIYVLGGLADTTLVVRDPSGQWHCNDDYPGLDLDPALVFEQPSSGDYAIWVGLHSNGVAEVKLHFSEMD